MANTAGDPRRILKDLEHKEIIIDKKEKEKTFAKLEINDKYNWEELRKEILVSQVKKALAPFNKIITDEEFSITVRWNRKGLPEINIEEIAS